MEERFGFWFLHLSVALRSTFLIGDEFLEACEAVEEILDDDGW